MRDSKRVRRFLFILVLFLGANGWLLGLNIQFKGLLAGWAVGKIGAAFDPQFGARFVPEFSLQHEISASTRLAADLGLNIFGFAQFRSGQDAVTEGDIEPYRASLRFSTPRFEARLGLQRINFGSASLLRPLMWFDSLDPRDPLQLTPGVYALLMRYYFANNANVWAWALYGNKKARAFDSALTAEDTVEYGGRAQLPVKAGELALTYHHRTIDFSPSPTLPSSPLIQEAPEDRIGLDGKWDIGVGAWFEAVLIRQESRLLPQPWQRVFNVGLDYTFSWGNGLNVMGEYFRLERSRQAFGRAEGGDFSAILLRYPVSILDDVTGIFYYDWDQKNFYRFISWQRTYDRWRFHIIAFWNPEAFSFYPTQAGASSFSGKGFQVMVIYNY